MIHTCGVLVIDGSEITSLVPRPLLKGERSGIQNPEV